MSKLAKKRRVSYRQLSQKCNDLRWERDYNASEIKRLEKQIALMTQIAEDNTICLGRSYSIVFSLDSLLRMVLRKEGKDHNILREQSYREFFRLSAKTNQN